MHDNKYKRAAALTSVLGTLDDVCYQFTMYSNKKKIDYKITFLGSLACLS